MEAPSERAVRAPDLGIAGARVHAEHRVRVHCSVVVVVDRVALVVLVVEDEDVDVAGSMHGLIVSA